MRFYAWAVALLMASVALAGCSGGDDGTDSGGDGPPDKPQVTETTGAIQGTVASDESLPIEGAQVQAREMPDSATLTAPNGGFVINDLEPGKYTVDVAKLGYRAFAGTVDVQAGEVTPMNIVLTRISSADPFADYQDQVGRVLFSFGWSAADCALGGITCNAAVFSDSDYISEHAWQVSEAPQLEIETIVVSVEWVPTSTVCQSQFQFDVLAPGIERGDTGGVAPDDPKRFEADTTVSPITIRIDREALEANLTADEIAGEWTTRAFARSGGLTENSAADLGCSQEQEFHVYYTVFYGEPAAAGFTGLPDQ